MQIIIVILMMALMSGISAASEVGKNCSKVAKTMKGKKYNIYLGNAIAPMISQLELLQVVNKIATIRGKKINEISDQLESFQKLYSTEEGIELFCDIEMDLATIQVWVENKSVKATTDIGVDLVVERTE